MRPELNARTAAERVSDDRGAAVIEAALLVPILMLLLFGVMEWGLVMRDMLSITESARVGARTASALPRQTDFTATTVAAIGQAGSALPKSQLVQILVYKANDEGFPGPDGATTMTCAGHESTCDRYVWDAGSNAFVLSPASEPWNPRSGVGTAGNVNACPAGQGGPPDSVGVYVEAIHPWVTGLFGGTRTLRDHAVLPFEPMPVGVCQ